MYYAAWRSNSIGVATRFFVLLALALMSSGCPGPDRPRHSYINLHLWGPELADSSVARLVRVEVKGGGWPRSEPARKNQSGTDSGVLGRTWPVRVPTSGTLFVRVALVAPTGDTLVRSVWDTIRLQRSYKYSIVVAVADSSGPQGGCGPAFKGYGIPGNRFIRYDSLLVEVSGTEVGAIC